MYSCAGTGKMSQGTAADAAMEVDNVKSDNTESTMPAVAVDLTAVQPKPTVAADTASENASGEEDRDWEENLDGLLNLLDEDSDPDNTATEDNTLHRARLHLVKKRAEAEEAIKRTMGNSRATYEAILTAKAKLAAGVLNLNGEPGTTTLSTGTFALAGDGRHAAAFNCYDMSTKQSTSTSFDPVGLVCHTCTAKSGHHILQQQSGMRTAGALFCLADHCFPAVLSSSSNQACPRIIRVEYGSITDVVDKLKRLLRTSKLPPNSVILVGLPSYLDRVGLEKYTAELTSNFEMLRRYYPGVKVGHLPPLLLCGTSSEHLIRSLCELSAWLAHNMKDEDTFVEEAFSVAHTIIRELATSGHQSPYNTVYSLPATWSSALPTKTWNSGGWKDLPSACGFLDEEREKRILRALLRGLNNTLALDLDCEPCTSREIGAGSGIHNRCRFLVIGDGNASLLAAELHKQGAETAMVTSPGFRATTSAVKQVADRTRELLQKLAPDYILMMGLDSSVFIGVDDGLISFPIREDNGKFHIKGDLRVMGKEALFEIFKQIQPLLSIGDGRTVFLVTPYNRWVLGKCCDDPLHITNFNDGNYLERMEEQLKELATTFKTFAFKRGHKNVKVLDPAAVARGIPRAELWDDSPSTPSKHFFQQLAASIISTADTRENKRKPEPDPATAGTAKRPAAIAGENGNSNFATPGHARGGGQGGRGGGYAGHGGRRFSGRRGMRGRGTRGYSGWFGDGYGRH